MPRIEMLGIQDFMKLLREYGISCSFDTTKKLISKGVFPFATAVEGSRENTEFFIFKTDAVKWLNERVTE